MTSAKREGRKGRRGRRWVNLGHLTGNPRTRPWWVLVLGNCKKRDREIDAYSKELEAELSSEQTSKEGTGR